MYQSKKSKTKQFVTGLIGASLALSLAFAVTVKADTVSDLTAQINSLLATVSGLQSKLSTVQGGAPASSSSTGYSFSKDLSMGSSGADVMNLQKVLNMSADTQVSSTGAGSKGNETSKFGPATKAAVIKWQKKAGLPSTGYVGSLSRGKLNAMSAPVVVVPSLPGVITTAPVVQSGTGLTVSSPVQPAATIAPKATSRVPFTKVTLTAGSDGDVTVNSLTVQRTGLANDSAFGSIVLLDENGLQIGTSKTFNSNHQTTVGDPFVISRGTSKTLTIAGNMAADQTEYSGQVASLTVVGVNTSATVTGSLPIVGAGQTVNNSLTIGTAVLYVSQYDPASALSKNIGDTATKFSGIKVSAGSSEDVTLWSVRWNQTGSAGTTDLANVVTVLDGTSYPTTVSTDGKYYTTLFPNGIVIQKGFSKEFFIQGDIVGSGAASRTVEFDLYNASDLYVSGNTYNFGILSTANSSVAPSSLSATSRSRFTTGSPFYAGSIVTISAGTATTIGKAPTAAPATNIAVNVPNQILGAYETNIKGEPISVQSTVFHLNSSAAYASNLIPTSISLIDKNGSVVAGPKDAVAGTAASELYKVTFTDTITYPVGVGTYTLVGKLTSNWTNGSTFMASTTPSSDWTTVKGQITGNTLTLSNAVFAMNTMTIRTASLSVAASNNPAAQTVVAGSQKFVFTNLQFDATQSGEDVRLSTIAMTLTKTGGNYTDLSACQLYDGATVLTTGSNVINPTVANAGTETFTLDQSFTIPKGTVKTLSLKCDVASSATAFIGHWDVTAAQATALTVTGTISTGTVTATGSATGGAMTVGSATLAATGDTSGTSYKVVAANTSGIVAAAYRFKASNDNVSLQRIVLSLTNTASSSSSDITMAHIFDGNTEVGSATFTGGSFTATSTLSTAVLLTRDTDKILTVKIDLSAINNSSSATTSGHLINVDINTNDSTGTYGTGVGSGIRVNSTGSTSIGSTGIRVFRSFTTIAQDTLTASGLSSNVPLLRFKVTADSKGAVNIAKFTLNMATSSVSVTGVNMYAFTDSSYSQPLSGVNTGGQLLTSNVDLTVGYLNSPTIAIYPQTTAGATTTVQVAPGSTMYFEVRAATVTVVSTATNYNVVTTLKGDTAYPAVANAYSMTALSGGIADSSSNSALNRFIWSPNSTTTPTVSDIDWTNGYAIPGLPSNGLSQSRSN